MKFQIAAHFIPYDVPPGVLNTMSWTGHLFPKNALSFYSLPRFFPHQSCASLNKGFDVVTAVSLMMGYCVFDSDFYQPLSDHMFSWLVCGNGCV